MPLLHLCHILLLGEFTKDWNWPNNGWYHNHGIAIHNTKIIPKHKNENRIWCSKPQYIVALSR